MVQIYGISFCGSTLLDLMIGNDPSGKHLSCGEVYALYGERGENREDEISPFWKDARGLGEDNLYKKLFDKYGFTVISDSSKRIDWLRKRAREAEKQGITVYKVVLFKSPEGWVGSMLKRGNKVNIHAWVNMYRDFMKQIPDATYIEYKTLATETRRVLWRLCKDFNIPYFERKPQYWQTPNTQIFGNANTRTRQDLRYTEDKTHKEYNTRDSAEVYQQLKKLEARWIKLS